MAALRRGHSMQRKLGVVWCFLAMACGRIHIDARAAGDDDSDAGFDIGLPLVSCSGLAATCGPAGTASCCSSPLVPGGMFYRGFDVGTDNLYTDMSHPATTGDFRLDRYEVTVGRFRQFVTAGMGTQQNPPPASGGARTLNGTSEQGGWDPAWNANLAADTPTLLTRLTCLSAQHTWTDAPSTNESLPINCLSWYDAMAFCVWDGGFLPTEAEWTHAAAGGSEQRAYPWSSPPSSVVIDCSYANFYGLPTYCVAPGGGVNRVGSESPLGDGKWGQADLGGNLWEWTLDSYQFVYGNSCDDCADLTSGSSKSAHGGSSFVIASDLRAANHVGVLDATARSVDTGVRCARAP